MIDGADSGTRAANARSGDAVLALLLVATVFTYLATLPLNLSIPDEAHALLAAKRVGTGEVLYRDVFDLSTPGWVYLMAALFNLFGPTLAVARLTVAVIHAITAALVFAACRELGVRRTLAWATGLTYLVVCQPMFPVASYHWLATGLSTFLLVLCLRPDQTRRWACGLGIVVGLLIAVHQQRGAVTGLGVAALFVALSLLRWRDGGRLDLARLARQLAALAAGALVVVASTMIAVVAEAGVGPVWDALIVFPLFSYRIAHRAAHYGMVFGGGGGTPPLVVRLLPFLPLAVAASAASLLVLVWRGGGGERARHLAVLALLGGFAVASIMYYPDVIHIAFVAPVFVVALAELAEWTLGLLPPRLGRALGLAASGVVVMAGSARLLADAVSLSNRHPIPYDSAFGRVDLVGTRQRALWEQLRARLDTTPARMLYVYPLASYVHLLVDARNPTRFGLVVPSSPYTPAAQVQEIVDALDTQRVAYVVASTAVERADDPIAHYIREHYQRVPAPAPLASLLWERRDHAVSSETVGRQ